MYTAVYLYGCTHTYGTNTSYMQHVNEAYARTYGIKFGCMQPVHEGMHILCLNVETRTCFVYKEILYCARTRSELKI
jgi:hypothetical protein